MPLLLLEPGQSIQLGPNENPEDPDAVTNPNPVAGQYTTQVGDTIAVPQSLAGWSDDHQQRRSVVGGSDARRVRFGPPREVTPT